jgi:hypothetical protein
MEFQQPLNGVGVALKRLAQLRLHHVGFAEQLNEPLGVMASHQSHLEILARPAGGVDP